jgi:hypothetical protein
MFASEFLGIVFMDYSAPDLVQGDKKEMMMAFLREIMTWPNLVDSSMFYTINFLPIFFIIPILPFYKECRSYFNLGKQRFKKLGNALLKTILSYSLIAAFTTSLTFSAFYSFAAIFVYNRKAFTYIGEFASIFPKDFYSKHPYLFFIFMSFTIYFALAFVFALLGIGISFFVNKEYKIIIIVLAIYHLYGNLGVLTNYLPFKIFNCVTAFNTLYSFFETFIPLILILAVAIALNILGIRKVKRNVF